MHDRVALGAVGEDFGVAGIVDPRGVQRFLVERRGGDGGDLLGERRVDGPLDIGERLPGPWRH